MLRTLDMLGFAAVAVSREGLVSSTNNCSARMFDKDFFVREQRLHTVDLLSKDHLNRLISAIRSGAVSQLMRTVVSRPGRLPVVIDAALGVGTDLRVPNSDTLLLLTDLEDRRIVSPHTTEVIFGLTATQAKVASLLAEGKSLSEIASAIGISPGTVRNHLKEVFARTGTRRQGELVSLMSRVR